MPSLSHTSLIRVHRNHSPLVVAVTHVLQLDASDHPVLHLDAPLVHPVLLHVLNSPVLSFTGIVNGVPVLPGQVMHSAVLQHVLGCLAENASQLGLGHVSDPYVDPVTDLPSVSLAPSLACPSTLTSRVCLRSIHLQFIWDSDILTDSPLFSTRLLLPLRSVLDEIGETFICEHMDNRYPFIFGVARKNFEIESQFFPALAQSLQGIVKRSATPCFRRRGSRLLRDIHRKVSMYRSASDADLNSSRHLGSTQVSDESVLSTALGIIFRDGVHPSRSKATRIKLKHVDGDDDVVIAEPSLSPAGEAFAADELFWDDHAPRKPTNLSPPATSMTLTYDSQNSETSVNALEDDPFLLDWTSDILLAEQEDHCSFYSPCYSPRLLSPESSLSSSVQTYDEHSTHETEPVTTVDVDADHWLLKDDRDYSETDYLDVDDCDDSRPF